MSMASHQETVLHHGEVVYTQGKLEDAFGAFRKVILLCDCNKALRASSKRLAIPSKDIPLPICHCKDYLSLPIDDPDSGFSDKAAIFHLATQPCSCGSGIKPCHNPAHTKALINIANVHVAQKAYRKAVQFASLAITLAPHVPEGYLRMVTVIRQGGLQCTPDVKSRCNWLDTQASHTVRAHGDKNHELLKPIARRIRRDIVRGVPVEIRQMIFQHLSHVDVCRAMRVSKFWKLVCRDRQLWKDLKLVKNWRHTRVRPPLRPGTLNNIVKLSGHMATSLTIDGLWDFKFDGAKLRALLKALPELETLSLAGRYRVTRPEQPRRAITADTPEFPEFWAAIWEDAPSTLTTLHLSSFDTSLDWEAPRPVLRQSHLLTSLKELSLVQLSPVDADLVMTTFMGHDSGCLCTLVVKDCYFTATDNGVLDLANLLPHHSRLRSVTLDGFVLSSEPFNLENDETYTEWECLERLVLGRSCLGSRGFPASHLLRSLELNHDGLNLLKHLTWSSETRFPKALEHFRCHYDPHTGRLQYLHHDLPDDGSLFAILRPSIESGTLRSLDLTFCRNIKSAIDELLNNNQKNAICSLSCHEISMPSIIDGYGGDYYEFSDWVETFPNLTTIGVYPQKSENAHELISIILKKRPDINTIYTNVLKGANRDRILAKAKKNGTTIIHADRVPEPILER